MATQTELSARLRAALKGPVSGLGDLGLTSTLRAVRVEDIAEAARELSNPEILAVFNWLDNERAAELLGLLNDEATSYVVENAPSARITDMLDRLPMDDAADVLDEASPEKLEELLTSLEKTAPDDAEEIRDLLSYPERSAGRLMTDAFMRLRADMSVNEAFAAVRDSDDEVETLSDLYITETVNEDREVLIGVISLRELVRAGARRKDPNVKVRDFMTTDVISVSTDTDQEECARLISKYDFMAMPVLEHGNFVGIVTVDDIIDVLVEEGTEDMLALGAVTPTEKPYLANSIFDLFKQRFGWLLLLFVAESMTGFVLRNYQGELEKVVALSFFVPLLIGSGGNAGAQAVTTITRALALGEVNFRDIVRVIWREARAGLLLGSALGLVGFVRVLIWGNGPNLALVIGISQLVVIVWAVTVGSSLPIVFKRLGLDPAVMSAPFITTLVDATGLIFYFTIAHILLPELK
ncbi:magnesium transporter MgtE [Abditibacteriota bacterium]|nr:magnesium transporter MgtE [Abditibacteriota bacterium]